MTNFNQKNKELFDDCDTEEFERVREVIAENEECSFEYSYENDDEE